MLSLITINNDDPSKSFKIATCCEQENIYVTIVNQSSCYKFKILDSDIKKFSAIFEMDKTIYKTSLISYITTKKSDISFNISCNNDFAIYKNNTTKYFYCDMEKVDYYSTMNTIIEMFSTENCTLKNNVNILESKLQKCENESSVYQSKLEEYVRENAEHENKLYSHFTHLLNEKKKRIQYLNDLLSADRSCENTMSVSSIIKKQKVHQQADVVKDAVNVTISDSESSENIEYNTDDETIPQSSKEDDLETNVKCLPQHISVEPLPVYDIKKTELQIEKNNEETMVVHDNNTSSTSATATFCTQDLLDLM